jgi:hypothetical protein
MKLLLIILCVIYSSDLFSQSTSLYGSGFFDISSNKLGIKSGTDTIIDFSVAKRVRIKGLIGPISTYNVLVHGLTDSVMYQVPVSAFSGSTTIYNGDGTLAGNRTVTGSSNSLTFDGLFNFRVNANTFLLSKSSPGTVYTAAVIGTPNNYQIGYTPTATVYSKGAGLYIDTNNNVGLGTSIPTTMPLYATGNSAFVNGFQSGGGNYYKVEAVTSNITAALTGFYYRIDATSGNITVTLPAASTAFGNSMGIHYSFKRIDNSGNTITIQRAGSDTIDGATSFTLTAQWELKELQCSSTSTWDLK